MSCYKNEESDKEKLIGLAVGDIESVQQQAELKMMATEIESVFEFEDKIPLVLRRRLYKPNLTIHPNKPSLMGCMMQKYFGWMGGFRRKKIFSTREMKEEEPTTTQIIGLRFTLEGQGHSITEIRQELRSQRELLEEIAKAIQSKTANDGGTEGTESFEKIEENILMKL